MSQAKNINTTSPSRRAVLAGIAAAPALAAPALAHVGDTRLRELWAQYLEDLAAHQATHARHDLARAEFDAEEPPCPADVLPGDHWRAQKPLREKYDLDRLYDAWNEAGERLDETVRAIREQQAEGLFGVGAKLAALPGDMRDPAYDHEHAIRSALSGIDRLIGTSFLSAFAMVSDTTAADDLHDDEGEDSEDEAVS